MKDDAQSGEQRSNHGKLMPESTALMAPAMLSPMHQLQFGDRRDQIAFVHAARFVVDV